VCFDRFGQSLVNAGYVDCVFGLIWILLGIVCFGKCRFCTMCVWTDLDKVWKMHVLINASYVDYVFGQI
jgi:hypothetical protein